MDKPFEDELYGPDKDHSSNEIELLAAIKNISTPLMDEHAMELSYLTELSYTEEHGERLTDAEYFLVMPENVDNDYSTVYSSEIDSAFQELLEDGEIIQRRLKENNTGLGGRKRAELLVELPDYLEPSGEFSEEVEPHIRSALEVDRLGRTIYRKAEESDKKLLEKMEIPLQQ